MENAEIVAVAKPGDTVFIKVADGVTLEDVRAIRSELLRLGDVKFIIMGNGVDLVPPPA